jgi:hypothetical protein
VTISSISVKPRDVCTALLPLSVAHPSHDSNVGGRMADGRPVTLDKRRRAYSLAP